jgi:hypothetical protein
VYNALLIAPEVPPGGPIAAPALAGARPGGARGGGGVKAALYFVELAVTDWAAAVRWYEEVLGLEVLARDEGACFALPAAGGGRLALKVNRLSANGVELEGAVKASPEGYRRARLRGPDGVVVTLFDWLPAQEEG